jgi:hypothetical protein
MTINGKGVQDSQHEGIAQQIRANPLKRSGRDTSLLLRFPTR